MTVRSANKLLRFKPLPYLVALLSTLIILGIHMLPNMDSMLNENNTRISQGFLKSQIDYHQEIAPFARRPLTSFLMESAEATLGLRPGHAFILVNWKEGRSLDSLKKWISAFLLTVVISTPIVILTAFARETRLFALPLLFIWPVFMHLFGRDIHLFFSWDVFKRLFSGLSRFGTWKQHFFWGISVYSQFASHLPRRICP